MKRILLTFLFLFCFVSSVYAGTSICGGRPAAGGAAGPSCTWGSGDSAIEYDHSGASGSSYDSLYVCTQFTLSAETLVTGYKAVVASTGGATNFRVSLYADNSNQPGTEISGTSKVVSMETWPGTLTDFVLATPQTVSAGTVWACVYKPAGATSRSYGDASGSSNYCQGDTPQSNCLTGVYVSVTMYGCQ